MDTLLSCSTSPDKAARVSKEDVLAWLRRNNYTQTCESFVAETEVTEQIEPQYTQPFCDGSETRHDSGGTPLAELRSSLEEALSAYQSLAGEGSVYALLDKWDASFLPTYYTRRAMGGTGHERSDLERRMDELQETSARQRARERELETQLKQTVTIIAERLQALVTAVDPMRKDIILPLLRTVATLGSTTSVRAAARHMMLTLYKRPIVEHRVTIVQEWLRVAREAPTRSLEQELIPELYSMVNAPAFERRLLALDCAAAVAPLLRQSPQVRYSLCQGLLRPLCEDDTSAVRRELPRCLSLMWGDATLGGSGGAAAAPAERGPAAAAGAYATTREETGATAGVTSSTITPGRGAVDTANAASLTFSQQAFVMELLVHLATDTSSRSVRQAAQTQLCEVLYPVFLRDGVLLSHFVPLLLTMIGMEATQMLLQRRLNNRSSGGASSLSAAANGAGGVIESGGSVAHTSSSGGGGVGNAGGVGGRKGAAAAEETTAAVASALSLSNVVTLVQLLHAALRCVAAEVMHAREEESRREERVALEAVVPMVVVPTQALADTYVAMVLPTAHSLLTPLLSRMRFAASLGEEGGSAGAAAVLDPTTQLCGPLCALCATLASLVPLLGAEAWAKVSRFLQASVAAPGDTAFTDTYGNAGASSTVAVVPPPHDTSQSPQELVRGRLLFAYSYLILLSGDGVLPPLPHHEAAPKPPSSLPAAEGTTRDVAAQPSVTLRAMRRTQQESLDFLAGQIRLDTDNLSSPRSAAMTACVHCIASLTPFAAESHEVASGVVALLRFLVASGDPQLRLTAIVLAHDACALVAHERLKVTLFVEPLLPLLEDLQPVVQEAALAAILSAASALTEPRAQERTIRPVLRVADTSGCTSRFARCVLMQWDQLLQRMPAEPREALLYPQLSALMDRLAEQYVERVSREGVPARADHAGTHKGDDDDGGAAAAPRVPSLASQDNSVEQWENTMLILQALLYNILRCAVVTPTLVSRYLLPGIQQLASEGVLSACSPNVRTRWHRLLKNYLAFAENNSGRFASSSGGANAGNLLDRVKDELKRRL